MDLRDTIKKEFAKASSRSWDKIYVFVDLHETILIPNWDAENLTHDYYEGAKELLQELSAREDICLVLWTCSHHAEICQYLKKFKTDDIRFDFINGNPEVTTDYSGENNYGDYSRKPYWNILLDDKAGFFPSMIPEIRAEFSKHSLEAV